MFFFLKELNQILEDGFKTVYFKVPDKKDAFKNPDIHIGAIPPRRGSQDKEDFPFIVNRVVSGDDSQDDSVFTVNTICGIFTGGTVEAGENEILNMVCRTRSLIIQNSIVGKRYRLEYPIKWHMGSVENKGIQAYPFFGGVITSKWAGPAYEYNLSLEDMKKVYGYRE